MMQSEIIFENWYTWINAQSSSRRTSEGGDPAIDDPEDARLDFRLCEMTGRAISGSLTMKLIRIFSEGPVFQSRPQRMQTRWDGTRSRTCLS